MNKLEIVKMLLDNSLKNCEEIENKSQDKSYYSGIVARLRGFK